MINDQFDNEIMADLTVQWTRVQPIKGGKGSAYEGGVRVPMMVARPWDSKGIWPIKGKTVKISWLLLTKAVKLVKTSA